MAISELNSLRVTRVLLAEKGILYTQLKQCNFPLGTALLGVATSASIYAGTGSGKGQYFM